MAETIETLGKYEIKRTLGKGAMGTVYEGWDPIIARRVAIKTVRIPDTQDDPETEEALARFRREAQAAGRLTHPNIVGVFDYGETGDIAYIVMEYVDGPSVKSLVDKQERFAIGDTMRIMTDLLNGLQFSHARGVVHRDIKPANVMLTKEGQGKIADFGIARIESSSMTQAGTVLGTPAYMSPEQFMGQVVDARTDIYSSGVLLYQLLTGERPFEGGMSAIMHKALNTDPPLPSQITVTCPTAFDGVVRKAMAKRPEERFQSATEFLEALQAASSGRPVPGLARDDADSEATMVAAAPRRPAARPVAASAAVPAAAPKRSALPMIAAAVVVVVALLGGGAWFFLLRGSAPAPVAPVAQNTAPAVSSGAPGAAPPRTAGTTPSSATPAPAASAPARASGAPQAPPQATAGAPAPSRPPPVASATGNTPLAAAPQLASAGLDTIRQQIAQLAANQNCALIEGGVRDDGNVTLTGLAGPSAADAVRQALAGLTIPGAVDWQIDSVNPIFCPALGALHPIVPAFGAVGPRLGLTLAGGKTRLHDGEQILPRLEMADFRGSLLVDYVGHDGTVLHLYPQLADPKQGMTADPPRVFRAGEAVRLGVAGPGHPAWEVGPPYGTDMIIAVASSQPLFDRPRPGNVETAAKYLRDLRVAVDAAQRRGERVAGNAVTVDTIAK
ncbi:MAG TPA: protein kinase [Acetobacteraceae bacterium]|nr:protein kinase [Acetobacteraceae bacterium]